MTIFTRLTFNENHWILPSGHQWKSEKQGVPSIPFENQYGYGNEEWLFNSRYHVGGYQYGYIRGLIHHRPPEGVIDRLYLYSVRKLRGMRVVFYVGYIDKLEIIGEDWRERYPAVAEAYEGYEPSVIQEIQEVKGDPAGLDAHEFRPIVRFRMDNAAMPEAPVKMNFPLDTYKRYKPYTITPVMEEVFRRAHNRANKTDQ